MARLSNKVAIITGAASRRFRPPLTAGVQQWQ